MKTITIATSMVTTAVATASNFTQKEGDYAGKIVLAGTDSKLEVKASDYTQTIIFKDLDFVSSDLTDNSFKAFSIDAKRLSTVLKNAKTDEVQIELHSEHIVVKSGRSKVKIETMANVQEINISRGGKSLDLSSQIGSMEQLLHAVDTNNPKFELNGVLLQSKNGSFNIVATDTKRLGAITTPTDMDDAEYILPKRAVETISKLFKGFDINIEATNASMIFSNDNVSYSTQLINGKYPEWQRIMPKTIEQSVVLPRTSLSELVKEASIFDDEIIISLKNNQIVITDFGRDTEVVQEFELGNTNITFGIKAKSVIDFLHSFEEENVQIGFNGSNLPIMLIANPEYKEVVMPVVMPTIEEEQDEEVYYEAS